MKAIPSLTGSPVWLVAVAALLGSWFAQNTSPTSSTTHPSIPPCKGPRSVPDPEHMVRPKYPKKSLQAGAQGTVELRAVVDRKGRTQNLTVVDGETVFATPALEAVRKWNFHPVVVEGKPLETTYKVRVRFVPLLQEAIPDWEIEFPEDPAEAAHSVSRRVKRDTPDWPGL